ncbi:MAG: DUF4157 domain-containing protein [Pseudomonadota bacterium]
MASEREADRIADQVMAMPEPAAPATPPAEANAPTRPVLARSATQPSCAGSDGVPTGLAAATAVTTARLSDAPLAGLGPGSPLTRSDRAFFEARMGRDLSAVRVHESAEAAGRAASYRARAFAYGPHVVMGGGAGQLAAAARRHLMAHELAHVAQQGHAPPVPGAAGRSAIQAPAPRPVSSGAATVQRAPEDDDGTVMNCTKAAGDIFDTPYLFKQGSTEFLNDSEASQVDHLSVYLWENSVIVDIHGFASEEGGAARNDALSCQRANTIAQMLIARGIQVNLLYAHGEVPGERKFRRSVVIDEIGTEDPGGTEEPEIDPEDKTKPEEPKPPKDDTIIDPPPKKDDKPKKDKPKKDKPKKEPPKKRDRPKPNLPKPPKRAPTYCGSEPGFMAQAVDPGGRQMRDAAQPDR